MVCHHITYHLNIHLTLGGQPDWDLRGYRVPHTELGEQPGHLGHPGQHNCSHTCGEGRGRLQGAPQGVLGRAPPQRGRRLPLPQSHLHWDHTVWLTSRRQGIWVQNKAESKSRIAIEIQVSVYILLLMGNSLIVSSMPIAMELAMDICYPAGEGVVCNFLTISKIF